MALVVQVLGKHVVLGVLGPLMSYSGPCWFLGKGLAANTPKGTTEELLGSQ